MRDIEQYKKILGVAGRRGITDCDISGLCLSIDRNIPFSIDDFKAQFHFSSFFDDHDIFFGVLLVCSILAEFMGETEVFGFIFDELVFESLEEYIAAQSSYDKTCSIRVSDILKMSMETMTTVINLGKYV